MERARGLGGVVAVVLCIILVGSTALLGYAKEPPNPVKQIDRLNIGLVSLSPEILAPMIASLEGISYYRAMYEPLVGVNRQGTKMSKKTGIAYDWKPAKDYRSWTFFIRKGVNFHNGWGEVTAEDVKFSLMRMISERSTYVRKGELKKFIKDIEILGPYKIKVLLKEKDTWFPFRLSLLNGLGSMIVSKKYVDKVGWEKQFVHPVGTGPYKFAKHIQGSYIEFEAVKNHWLWGTPRYKTVLFYAVPEEETRVAMLKTGELDIAQLSMEKLEELSAFGNVHYKQGVASVGGWFQNGWLEKQGDGTAMPTHDIRVRKALSFAIDREAINKAFFKGKGVICRSWPAGELAYGYEPSLDVADPYDPQEAKKLLTEAGYPKGFKIKLLSFPMGGAPQAMINAVIASYWEAIGVKTSIEPLDYGAFKAKWKGCPSKYEKKGDCAWVLFTVPDRPCWSVVFDMELTTYGNFPFWRSAKLDPLCKKILGADFGEEYESLFQKIYYKIVYKNRYTMGLMRSSVLFVTNPESVLSDWDPGKLAYDINFPDLLRR